MGNISVTPISRKRKSDGRVQKAHTHCLNAQKLSKANAVGTGLETLAGLTALLHDMGKFTDSFRDYVLNDGPKNMVYHSPTGAIYAYERWFGSGVTEKITAQIISSVIRAHHGGLLDNISPDITSPYLDVLARDKESLHYAEAVEKFTRYCKSEEELQELFEKSCSEIESMLEVFEESEQAFAKGMITKLILSCVIDADRWDSACFASNEDPFRMATTNDNSPVEWKELSARLETRLNGLDKNDEISQLRREVSEVCLKKSAESARTYTLTVQPGGGKTLSGLRFGLNHAAIRGLNRVFYVIPFNTILEQTGEEISLALDGYEGILEHYGDFYEGKENEDEVKTLTERWNSPLILTSMVQFLNTIYKGTNTNTRRLCRLANSVIVFDEIQALPKKCTVLFEKAIKYLSKALNCTVVLCTATQPSFKIETEPIIDKELYERLEQKLKRVSYADKSAVKYSNEKAAEELAKLQKEHGSALLIVNTTKVAQEIFNLVRPLVSKDCKVIHLSTNMCPAHRSKKVEELRTALDEKNPKPVICISTALIEAGVDISFPCVVRSFAGLPSIVQAAGRCNRNMKLGTMAGKVEVWFLAEENLKLLPDIKLGQKLTENVSHMPNAEFASKEMIDLYFDHEREEYKSNGTLDYPFKERNTGLSLVSMLSLNKKLSGMFYQKTGKGPDVLNLRQAFESAGKEFNVIDQDTVSVLVNYNGCADLLSELLDDRLTLYRKIRLLSKAQAYSVSIYSQKVKELEGEGIISKLDELDIYILSKDYYSNDLGRVRFPIETTAEEEEEEDHAHVKLDKLD